ncbi:MAG: 7-carboxy-7-deazaguanine synthase QueE [Desulfobacteraceae bacterium]|nr:7-carboxy-7-deazaguanine synthase QueE [Desulfobacteraceae bacterium]
MNELVHLSEVFSSIQGEGYLAGRRQIFIRLTDCNLDCSYCDTDHARRDSCRVETFPGSSEFRLLQPSPHFNHILQTLKGWCASLPGVHHSISITGGEPLLHADRLATWLPALRRLLPIHLETNGTMHLAMEQLIGQVDYVSMDMKLPSTSGCTEHLWDLHREFLRVAHGKNTSVKVVIGDETVLDEIEQVCGIISDVDRTTPLFLQPLSMVEGGLGIRVAHMLRLQEAASARLPDVRVIPQMHRMLGAL